MSKAQIRRQKRHNVQNRPNNLRYNKANSIDDLVAAAAIMNKKRRRKEKRSFYFETDFDMPTGTTKTGNKNSLKPVQQLPPSLSSPSKITVERNAVADSWFETMEIPVLAAVAALGISSAYGLSYFERRIVFILCAVVAAVGRRWVKNQEKEEQTTRQDVDTLTTSGVLFNEQKLAMPFAWCFVAYWCLGGRWWLRSLVACVAFGVRFNIEKGRARQKNMLARTFR